MKTLSSSTLLGTRTAPIAAAAILVFSMSTSAVAQKADADDPALKSIRAFIESANVNKNNSRWKSSLKKPAKATFDASKDYYWNLETNKGKIRVRFLPDVAPMHVTSTIYLTELGFYDDIKFHRVIPGFMAQGGCPQGRGTGGPGYQYPSEFSPSVKHSKGGLLSMANRGPGTDGSQFFLTFKATPWLDGKHTIFGEIDQGMDTLKKLEAKGTRGGATTEPLSIVKATITTGRATPATLENFKKLLAERKVDTKKANWKTSLEAPPRFGYDGKSEWSWKMKTNKGEMTIKLLSETAPQHVTSTVYLTLLGFYDDLTFHRVIPGFMAQGGCPTGTGRSGPGYQYAGEFDPKVKHDRPGLLSMANAGPGTDGSQFFLTFVKTPWLDGKHTIFGEVVEGKGVLKLLEAAGTPGRGATKEPLKIEKCEIVVTPKKAAGD